MPSGVMGDRVPPVRDALARLMFEHVLPHVSSALRMPHGGPAHGSAGRRGGMSTLLIISSLRPSLPHPLSPSPPWLLSSPS